MRPAWTARILALLSVLLAVGASSDTVTGDTQPARVGVADPALLAAANGGDTVASEKLFAADLVAALGEAKRGNLVVSPLNVFGTLALLAPGARGDTAVQLAQAMHVGDTDKGLIAEVTALERELESPGKSLRIAKGAWVEQRFAIREAYRELLSAAGAPPNVVSFATAPDRARQAINAWVSEHTEGRIPNLLGRDAVDHTSVLVLVGALALDAVWSAPFMPADTTQAPFHAGGGERTVATMHATRSMDYLDAARFSAVRLPYQAGGLQAVVALPDDVHADPLSVLPDVLAAAGADGFTSTYTALALPKFEMQSRLDLHQAFSDLGLGDLFGLPDLSGIAGAPGDLQVGAVLHQALLSVDEAGTKGAAATAIVVRATSLRRMPEPVRFTADRPFLFLVTDAHGVPVFVARVTDPR